MEDEAKHWLRALLKEMGLRLRDQDALERHAASLRAYGLAQRRAGAEEARKEWDKNEEHAYDGGHRVGYNKAQREIAARLRPLLNELAPGPCEVCGILLNECGRCADFRQVVATVKDAIESHADERGENSTTLESRLDALVANMPPAPDVKLTAEEVAAILDDERGETEEPTVTVCSACRTEACWKGELMCEEARSAGTVEIRDGTGKARKKP